MMKKIITSAAVAAALTTGAFAAGTLTVDGSTYKVSKELLQAKAVDVNITTAIDYKAGIANSSAAEPGFEIVFAGLTPSAKDLLMIDADTNATVAQFSRIDGSSIILDAKSGASVNRNKTYRLVSNDSNSSITAGDLKLTLPKGTTSAKAKLILTDNTGFNTLDTVEDDIITTVQQFSASVKTKLSEQIDSSKDFKTFLNSGTTDTYEISFVNLGSTLDYDANATKVDLVLFADQNLTKNGYTVGKSAGSGNPTVVEKDLNTTSTYNDAESDNNQSDTMSLAVDGASAMSITTFTASAIVTVNGITSPLTIMDKAEAGKWDIYGYTAQIPNVVAIASRFETTIKFTNKGNEDANIYFTLRDKDGTVALVNSATNTNIPSLKAGTTSTYNASTLLAQITDVAFNKASSMSVEVSVPATPTNIYGFASFRNLTLGQFKDLPIYNSSTLNY
jgi:hypothetical protein